jgi:hypothetical protein
MDACERQQYIGEQRERIMAEATRATLDRLRDLRPRAAPIDIPDGLFALASRGARAAAR